MKKKCNKCGEIKSVGEFYKHKATKDRLCTYCKLCMNEISRLWRTNNEIDKDYYKKYYQNRDREELRCYWRKIDKRRRLTDSKFVLNNRMRTLIFQVLRGKKRGISWREFVDYTIDDLVQHLELQFTEGMTWEKFIKGEIHIDHIVPKSSFVFDSPDDEQFKKCWSLSNLQPLWAIDNLRKYNKLSPMG